MVSLNNNASYISYDPSANPVKSTVSLIIPRLPKVGYTLDLYEVVLASIFSAFKLDLTLQRI